MRAPDDIVVVGGGPAGLAAAAACAEAGLSVTALTGPPGRGWPQTFGVWADEIEAVRLSSTLATRWPTVSVHLGEAAPRRLERAYGRVDNERLRGLLLARAERAGARLRPGRAVSVEHLPARTTVVSERGARLACRVAVDASGHRPVLLTRGTGRACAYQAAYGIVARFRAPEALSDMLLMDYRDPPGHPDDPAPDHPTFLYGIDLGDGRHLLEETSLARRPAFDHAALKARLHRRLASMGVRAERELAVERVLIPMGGPLPPRSQPVVGFGAAAGMVHPATGYQVATALRRAPLLAAALARGLDQPGATTRSVAAAGWHAVWPPDLVRQRALHVLGLESLLRLGPSQTRRFFRAFFDLPPHRWSRLLSGDESAGALAATMALLFARLPPDVRARLAVTALGHPGLLRAAVG